MIKKVIKYIINFGRDMSRHNVPAFASSVAFYFFMSLIPILMFVCSLLPYLPFTEHDIVMIVSDIIPTALVPSITGVINNIYTAAKGVIPVTVIASLWTAGMGMMGLVRGLNGILEIEDKRNYFVLRAVAVFYTLLMLAMLTLSAVFLILGEYIVKYVLNLYPALERTLLFLLSVRELLILIILTLILATIYTFLPAKRQKFLFVLPGAMIAGVGWLIATWVFKLYIDVFNGFSIYGSLTTIMVILFWLNILFNIVMFGAYLNKRFKPLYEVGYNQQKRIKDLKESSIDNIEN